MIVVALCVAASCVLVLQAPAPQAAPRGAFGVVAYPRIEHTGGASNCIPPRVHAELDAAIAARELAKARHGGGILAMTAAPPLLPFTSLGGNSFEDVFPGTFKDVDPTAGFKDFACHDFTYDGHGGHDIQLRSFAEQVIGVPVFAVRDGTVAFAQDGFPDMNTATPTDSGNYVIVDHGGGQYGWYFHLKKNSVAFGVGQVVKQGDQLGLAASSGYSYGPHLHFEVQQSFAPIEPSAGPCGLTQSLWAKQEPLELDLRVMDFGVTTVDLFTAGTPLPYAQPRQAQIPLNAGFSFYWMQLANVAPNSTYRARFLRPNGSVDLDTGTQSFGNPTFLRYWPGFFYFWVPGMQTIPGTWTYELTWNGAVVLSAPIEVVATVNPAFNRAPQPIAIAFEPALPTPAASLACRVSADAVLEDLDWDIVRYRYVWKVNGATVRDVVTAGRLDRLPRAAFAVGATVACTVTPNDGKVDGTPVATSAVAANDPWQALAGGTYGTAGVPRFEGTGSLAPLSNGVLTLTQAMPNRPAMLFVSLSPGSVPAFGGTLVPFPIVLSIALNTGPAGGFTLPFVWPAGIPSATPLALQVFVSDPAGFFGAASSNGVVGTTP